MDHRYVINDIRTPPGGKNVKVTASAISLNVADVAASANFIKKHFGFTESMTVEDKVASLSREDVGFNLIFLKTDLVTFKPRHRSGPAGDGLLVVLVVEEIDGEYARLQAEGAKVITPIETEPWGERYFQVEDPNGIIIQLVQWVAAPEVHSVQEAENTAGGFPRAIGSPATCALNNAGFTELEQLTKTTKAELLLHD